MVASKLRVAELAGRKEAGLTTSTLQVKVATSYAHDAAQELIIN